MDSGSGFVYGQAQSGAATARERWWLLHAAVPALLFATLFAVMHLGGGDRAVARAFHDPSAGWWLDPDLPVSQWLYRSERALIMAAVLVGLGVLAAGFWHAGARRWRRPVSYLLLCFAATGGLVSLGKHTTNVDCPRALVDYGGRLAHVGLLEDRPDALPRARCFPAGHSGAALSLVSLYFLLGALQPRWRWAGLAVGLGLGLTFASTQWARGMHFPSHDLFSAAIAWAVALAAYTALYRRRLWDGNAPAAD